MKQYTLDELKRMPPDDRGKLYQNAIRLRSKGGQEIIDLLDSSGLPLSSGGLSQDDPMYLTMLDIIWSPKARSAALEATSRGLPALAGVDPLLAKELKDRCNPFGNITQTAGYIKARLCGTLVMCRMDKEKCPTDMWQRQQ